MLLRCNIRCCISMLYFDVAFRCCISMLHFDAAFRCYISMLYFDVTFRCYISMLHFDAVFRCYILCYISMLHFMLHFYTTFTGYRTLFCSCLHIFFCIRTRSVRKRIRRIFRSRFSSSSQTFPILWDLALRFLPFEFCVLPPHSFGYSIIHTSFLQDTEIFRCCTRHPRLFRCCTRHPRLFRCCTRHPRLFRCCTSARSDLDKKCRNEKF